MEEKENSKKALVYGKSQCPHCTLAKKVLETNGYEISYINLDEEEKRKEFYDLTTKELGSPVMSVPQIWIGSLYVGGYLQLIEHIKSQIKFNEDF
jgi:glutaredoxin 3